MHSNLPPLPANISNTQSFAGMPQITIESVQANSPGLLVLVPHRPPCLPPLFAITHKNYCQIQRRRYSGRSVHRAPFSFQFFGVFQETTHETCCSNLTLAASHTTFISPSSFIENLSKDDHEAPILIAPAPPETSRPSERAISF